MIRLLKILRLKFNFEIDFNMRENENVKILWKYSFNIEILAFFGIVI